MPREAIILWTYHQKIHATGVCKKKDKFRERFAKFSRNVRKVFGSFRKVFGSFGSFQTCSDTLGCVRMCSDAWWPKKKGRKPETKILKKVCIFMRFSRSRVKTELATLHHTDRKNSKKQSVSKMKVQGVTINSVQESSKSELSSRGKRPFKVFWFYVCVFFFADTGMDMYRHEHKSII